MKDWCTIGRCGVYRKCVFLTTDVISSACKITALPVLLLRTRCSILILLLARDRGIQPIKAGCQERSSSNSKHAGYLAIATLASTIDGRGSSSSFASCFSSSCFALDSSSLQTLSATLPSRLIRLFNSHLSRVEHSVYGGCLAMSSFGRHDM